MLVLCNISVGAGTSGSVIASRLAQDKDTTILLIEAGENPELNPNIDIPIFADKVRGSEWDWSYKTTPQKHACRSHEDRVRAKCCCVIPYLALMCHHVQPVATSVYFVTVSITFT